MQPKPCCGTLVEVTGRVEQHPRPDTASGSFDAVSAFPSIAEADALAKIGSRATKMAKEVA